MHIHNVFCRAGALLLVPLLALPAAPGTVGVVPDAVTVVKDSSAAVVVVVVVDECDLRRCVRNRPAALDAADPPAGCCNCWCAAFASAPLLVGDGFCTLRAHVLSFRVLFCACLRRVFLFSLFASIIIITSATRRERTGALFTSDFEFIRDPDRAMIIHGYDGCDAASKCAKVTSNRKQGKQREREGDKERKRRENRHRGK